MIKVYLDGERNTRDGWVRVYWPDEAIALLKTDEVVELSLDHDLGDEARGTGYEVVLWIEEQVVMHGFVPPKKSTRIPRIRRLVKKWFAGLQQYIAPMLDAVTLCGHHVHWCPVPAFALNGHVPYSGTYLPIIGKSGKLCYACVMSIADFLFTAGQQRVLGAVLTTPDKDFTLTELMHRFGKGHGAAQTQVKKLIDAGVLIEQHLGNRRQIRANKSFPLYPELRSICLKTFGVKERLIAALVPLANQITRAFVFGSVARGTDTAKSDVDLMVIGDIDLIALMDVIGPLEEDLGRLIDVQLYTPDEWAEIAVNDAVVRGIAEGEKLEIMNHA